MNVPTRNLVFDKLREAVLYDSPQQIVDLVKSDGEILKETNLVGENIITWCALELMNDEVELLRSLGCEIQEQAISEAIQHQNTDMLLLLLELGGNISKYSAEQSLRIAENWGAKPRIVHIMKSHLAAYKINV